MKRKADRKAANVERAATLAANTAAAAAASGATAIGAALMAMFPPLLGAVLPGFLERKAREAQTWWNEVQGSAGSDRGIAAEIEAKIELPEVQDTIMAGFRAVLDRLAPAARTPIALLTREYARASREPDWFFRAVSQILTGVTAKEYVALTRLVGVTAASSFGEHATLRLNTQPGFDDVTARFSFTTDPKGFLDVQGGLPVMRVFALLQATGLGAPLVCADATVSLAGRPSP